MFNQKQIKVVLTGQMAFSRLHKISRENGYFWSCPSLTDVCTKVGFIKEVFISPVRNCVITFYIPKT